MINLDTKDSISSYQIKSISEIIQIPYISFYPNDKNFVKNEVPEPYEYSVSTNPMYSQLTQAFIDLISFVNWTKFIFLYEDSNSNLENTSKNYNKG